MKVGDHNVRPDFALRIVGPVTLRQPAPVDRLPVETKVFAVLDQQSRHRHEGEVGRQERSNPEVQAPEQVRWQESRIAKMQMTVK